MRTDQVFHPESSPIDGGVCPVNNPLADDVAKNATSAAVTYGDGDGGEHGSLGTASVMMAVAAMLIAADMFVISVLMMTMFVASVFMVGGGFRIVRR